MHTTVKDNLITALRQLMKHYGIAAVVVPNTDPHGSEYIAEHWQAMKYISGFTGEAGTVVVTAQEAALWTDSRYFLQAPMEIAANNLQLMKEGLPETPEITQWLSSRLNAGQRVAMDAALCSVQQLQELSEKLQKSNLKLDTTLDLVGEIWKNRPPMPFGHVREMPVRYAGLATNEKIDAVRQKMRQNDIDAWIVTALDDIAWLFNIRGNDIAYNPVVLAYAIIQTDKATLFIDTAKLPPLLHAHLQNQNVDLQPYENIIAAAQQLQGHVGIDFKKANAALYQHIQAHVTDFPSPVSLMKGVKNAVEMRGIRASMVRDGVAMVNMLYWLEKNCKKHITELDVVAYLHECRAQQAHFVSESFATIAAYGPHAAIVHYEPTAATNAVIEPHGLLLIDSGGQYLDGTTDITRTVSVGPTTPQERRYFTYVFKGMVALAMAEFPEGTRGTQLDILARQYLWKHGLQFGHGTGHGVGHFLNVHEGPHSIRMQENPTKLLPGMIVSDEPGVYYTNAFGIRHENIIAVKDSRTTPFGHFLQFETLTLCPFESNLLVHALLTPEETKWLNQYHRTVYRKLSIHLPEKIREWLLRKTQPI